MVHYTDNLIQMDETFIYGLNFAKRNPMYSVVLYTLAEMRD